MAIELQFRTVVVEQGELEEIYPFMFSALQNYLPIQKPPKQRRRRKKRESVADLIDPIIDSIDRGIGE